MQLVSTRLDHRRSRSPRFLLRDGHASHRGLGNELFAEIPTTVGTLAIGSEKTVPLFGLGSAEAAANRSAIIEFIVEDVDAEYGRLRERLNDVVTEPTTLPWGNRALLFRDPDGNLVNLFTPVTDDARAKFGMCDSLKCAWSSSASTCSDRVVTRGR